MQHNSHPKSVGEQGTSIYLTAAQVVILAAAAQSSASRSETDALRNGLVRFYTGHAGARASPQA